MGTRYADYVPPALAEVLGMPPFEIDPWFRALRDAGVEVPTRYEGEIGTALHFLIPFALSHGADWRTAAIEEIARLQAGGARQPATIPGWELTSTDDDGLGEHG